MPTKIILDVDTGSDDAVALMTAVLHPEIELVAACSVNGNQTIDKTTENTLRVMDFLKRRDNPVSRGCELPMVSTLNPQLLSCWNGSRAPRTLISRWAC